MVATEKFINSENSNVIEIEREDTADFITIYFNKEYYSRGEHTYNGRIIYESENVIKYAVRSSKKVKLKQFQN